MDDGAQVSDTAPVDGRYRERTELLVASGAHVRGEGIGRLVFVWQVSLSSTVVYDCCNRRAGNDRGGHHPRHWPCEIEGEGNASAFWDE